MAMGTTKANSAIVHAGFDAPPGSLKAKLNVRGSELMPQVARELGVKYKRNGSLVLGFCEEDRATIRTLYERGCQNGVKGLRILDQEEVERWSLHFPKRYCLRCMPRPVPLSVHMS